MIKTYPSKPLVYLAHPVNRDVSRNIYKASLWFRWAALLETVIPVAPYIAACFALDDDDPTERLTGMAVSSRVVRLCDELWLCGPVISEGMQHEAELAESRGIPVVDLTGHHSPSEMIEG